VLVNPTAAEIAAAISAANAAANPPRCSARLCRLPDLAQRILAEPAGVVEDDGGAVANSYGYRCETSWVLAAWWTHPSGDLHVRITGGRTDCRHASHGAGNGCAALGVTGWVAVYPDRAGQLAQRRIGRCRAALARLATSEHEAWYAERERLYAEREAALATIRQCSPLADQYAPAEAERQRCEAELAALGPQPTDDSRRLLQPLLVAVGADGSLLIADHLERPSLVQVAVRDATTGVRHHITVPPKFAHPARKTYQRIVGRGGKAALVHEAIAWTFELAGAEYAPAVQA
jgi:hypothetical protein